MLHHFNDILALVMLALAPVTGYMWYKMFTLED